MHFDPSVTDFLGALVVGLGLGMGWALGTWIVGRITAGFTRA